jgi:hypothetical protein
MKVIGVGNENQQNITLEGRGIQYWLQTRVQRIELK